MKRMLLVVAVVLSACGARATQVVGAPYSDAALSKLVQRACAGSCTAQATQRTTLFDQPLTVARWQQSAGQGAEMRFERDDQNRVVSASLRWSKRPGPQDLASAQRFAKAVAGVELSAESLSVCLDGLGDRRYARGFLVASPGGPLECQRNPQGFELALMSGE